MTEYRRFRHPGTTWFFTLNLAGRRGNRLLTDRTDLLRAAFPHVKVKHPYGINASVVLPDHLHCILPLPDGDSDFSTRWGLIKAHFSRHLEKLSGFQKAVQNGAGEACTHGAWQRRFGEHLIGGKRSGEIFFKLNVHVVRMTGRCAGQMERLRFFCGIYVQILRLCSR
ncbi:transposase [Methylovulum sp.]|uniref:REP-associated tyrosine transposase n=1 Tax=Methylovulum sp. TaxID=1916980 RepID=UPI00260D743B|nr:transposase [Methylovulum sp.]MDD5123445.1 transposase [Methylovulum sp.]